MFIFALVWSGGRLDVAQTIRSGNLQGTKFPLSEPQHSLQDKLTPGFNKDVFSDHLSCVILRNN